jgi:hypothetical protein
VNFAGRQEVYSADKYAKKVLGQPVGVVNIVVNAATGPLEQLNDALLVV